MIRRVDHSRRGGFTLVEMLLVLAVLAITTTIAVQSIAPVASQARYEATVQTLNSVRNAIVGPPPTTDGMQSVSGFIADVGRTPLSLNELLAGGDMLFPLHDLALQPLYTSWPLPWTTVASGTAADITVASGWKGPYVATPAGQTVATTTAIVDAWGRAINGPHSFTGLDWTIWSSGPNGIDDSSSAGAVASDDIPLVLYQSDYGVQSLAIHVYEYSSSTLTTSRPSLTASDSITAFVYSVQSGAFALQQSTTWTSTATTTHTSATSTSTSTSPTFDMSVLQLSMGPIVIQTFHNSGTTFTNATITKRSPPTVVTLRPSASVDRTLVMQ